MNFNEFKNFLLDLELPQNLTSREKIELHQIFDSKLSALQQTEILIWIKKEQVANLLELLALIVRGTHDESVFYNFAHIILQIANNLN